MTRRESGKNDCLIDVLGKPAKTFIRPYFDSERGYCFERGGGPVLGSSPCKIRTAEEMPS